MPFKFTYVCDLLDRLESLESRDVILLPAEKKQQYHAIIDAWFKNHRKLVGAPDTDRVALLSTLFPERRTDRVYFIKEQGLVKILGRCLGLGRERLRVLENWKASDPVDLATLVCNVQRATDAALSSRSLTVEMVDAAFAKVAARCRFSSPQVRDKSVKDIPEVILKPILLGLSSRDLKWFIRVILKRFNPVTLDEYLVLQRVHPLLPRVLKFQSTFQAAIRILEDPSFDVTSAKPDGHSLTTSSQGLRPQIGVKVGRPEFVKARSIKHCLNVASHGRWAIEPKYDGEYCQLHVDLSKGANCIQIFSKSGKDSTKDRRLMHDWIKACLQIGEAGCKFSKKCILEGEMVVYSDNDSSILDFHYIRKHVSRSGTYIGTEADSPRHPHEHLMIVFYDALLIDDEIVMAQPYEYRRRKLRELMHYYPGWCQTADWGTINFGKLSAGKAVKRIDRAFAKAIALRCEGLVLKPCDQPYFSLEERASVGRFIKLKKDYIPGLGDTADLAIVGASYNASEVPPEARNMRWTHFTIACLENKNQVCRYHERPVFRIVGILSRPCIPVPDLHFLSDHGQFVSESYDATSMPTNYDLLLNSFNQSMQVTFKKPFIVEVLGSSFEKPTSRTYFMLRHPRILKVYRDRGLEEVVSFDELQSLAHQARTLPEDAVQEEAEWLARIQSTHRPRDIYNMSTASQTTTTSPGSKRASPIKNPYKLRPTLFVRIDTSELLPGEMNVIPPTNVGSKKAMLKLATAMLPSPPPSSLPIPTASATASAPVLVQPSSSSLKRKRDEVDSTESRTEQAESTKLPLGDITNSFSSHGGSSRHGRQAETIEVVKIRKFVHFSVDMQENAANGVENSVEGTRAKQPSDAGSTAPVIARSTASPTSPRLNPEAHAKPEPHRGEGQPASPLPFRGEGHNLGKETKMAVTPADGNFWGNMQAIAKEMSSCPGSVSSDRQHAAVNIPATHKHGDRPTTHTRPVTPQNHRSLVTTVPFSRCTLYLSPCVAGVPYLTEDLVPRLLRESSEISGCISVHTQVTTSLKHWIRAIQDLPASLPAVPESQAYAGMQKAVLVESRRKRQTEAVIERVVKEVRLVQREVVEVWDWRAVEEVVDTMVAHDDDDHDSATRRHEGCLRGRVGVTQDAEHTRQERLQRAISTAVEQARSEDTMEGLAKVLQKWYLGHVCRTDTRNVWTAATEGQRRERAELMAATGGARA